MRCRVDPKVRYVAASDSRDTTVRGEEDERERFLSSLFRPVDVSECRQPQLRSR